jgi:hypothetical protein
MTDLDRKAGGRRGALWGSLPVFVVFLASVAFWVGPATASTWNSIQLSGEAAKVSMFGVSCPSASLCVAVGGQNTVATSLNPNGGVASWDVAYVGQGAFPTPPNGLFPGRQIRGISCPSTGLCVAVTFEGLIYSSTNPSGGRDAWRTVDLDGSGPNTHMYGVSCPTSTFCVAVAGGGKIITSTNPTGEASDWTVTQLDHPVELRGVSCVSASLCVAVGDDGNDLTYDGEIVSSTNPLGGVWQSVQMPAGQGGLYGISCPSPTFCVTGNSMGNLVTSSNPTGEAFGWRTTDGGGTVQITGVSCISVVRCVAVDNNGDVLTSTNPTGGPGAWTFLNVLPYPEVDGTIGNHLFGVSCPSTSLCAVAANRGQILTSQDPFEEPPKTRKPGRKGKKRGPKRPRTKIAHRPPPGIEIDDHKVKVSFRFFAMNKARVRGFVCKIDRRPLRRCHSPKSYGVGLGRHVFRVRAIGWSGLKGPPAVAKFKVCNPGPLPFCTGQFGGRKK